MNEISDTSKGIQLNSELVLWGYRRGIFPMADEKSHRILWFSPDPRGVLDLNDFHIPRTLRQIARQNRFRITINQCFERVIGACASRHPTWISPEIINVYCELKDMGFAYSVESWADDDLAGGLYGVALGGVFFGESMFHHITDGSKIALIALVQHMCRQGFALLDVQYLTNHLIRFGADAIAREVYLQHLQNALALDCTFAPESQTEITLTV